MLAPSLFGLAPGGVCRAASVAGSAVRSYRTVSPLRLPRGRSRSLLCGTVPEVLPLARHSLAGRYPAPYVHGARTFLSGPPFGIGPKRPSGRLTSLRYALSRAGASAPGLLRQQPPQGFDGRWIRQPIDARGTKVALERGHDRARVIIVNAGDLQVVAEAGELLLHFLALWALIVCR